MLTAQPICRGTVILRTVILTFIVLATAPSLGGDTVPGGPGTSDNIAVIQNDSTTGFSNAGWKYDRYQDLPSLDAHQRMVVADLTGAGDHSPHSYDASPPARADGARHRPGNLLR